MASMTEIIHLGKKDCYCDAAAAHRGEVLKAVAAGNAWDVSPMRYSEALGYYCELSWDDGEVREEEPEEKEDEPAAAVQALQYINVSEVLRDTAELLLGDDLGSPLVQQLDVWLSDPMTGVDPGHLLVTPSTYERVGRHVLGLCAAVLERQLAVQVGRLGDVRF